VTQTVGAPGEGLAEVGAAKWLAGVLRAVTVPPVWRVRLWAIQPGRHAAMIGSAPSGRGQWRSEGVREDCWTSWCPDQCQLLFESRRRRRTFSRIFLLASFDSVSSISVYCIGDRSAKRLLW